MSKKKNLEPVMHLSDLLDKIEDIIVVDDVREYGPGEIKELYENIKAKDSNNIIGKD